MKIRKECSYCAFSQTEWDMGDILLSSCPGFAEDKEGNCNNFEPLEEDDTVNNQLGNTDISVTMTQGDIIKDIIVSVENTYLPQERCIATLDFVLNLIDEYGVVGDDELSDSVVVTLLARKALERDFICTECGKIEQDDKSLILFDIDLDPRCPYCGSADIMVK